MRLHICPSRASMHANDMQARMCKSNNYQNKSSHAECNHLTLSNSVARRAAAFMCCSRANILESEGDMPAFKHLCSARLYAFVLKAPAEMPKPLARSSLNTSSIEGMGMRPRTIAVAPAGFLCKGVCGVEVGSSTVVFSRRRFEVGR